MGDRQSKKLAVFRPEDPVSGIPVSFKPAGSPENAQAGGHPGKEAIKHGYVDKLAFAGIVPGLQRSQDADGRKHSGRKIPDGHPRGNEISLFILKTVQHPGHGLIIQVMAWEIPIRTFLAVTGDGAVDQAGIYFP
jgi:hypothetical protein